MSRPLLLPALAALALALPGTVKADVGVYPVTKIAPLGGMIEGGGSLIQSGGRLEGETIRLTARPTSRHIRVGSAPTRVRFLVAEPAGIILLLRLTVPHGMRVRVTGTIPRLAGMGVSTDGRSKCRRHGAVDICTQPEEWCPMPAAAWHFDLRKLGGRPGVVELTFVIGPPPNG